MKRTDLPDVLQRMLHLVPYATIATVCPNGSPWNTPVRAFLDKDLTLYWVSWQKSQHSANVAHDPRAFVIIYNSRLRWPKAHRRGLYMQMHVTVLEDLMEVRRVRERFAHQFGEADDSSAFTGDNPRRIYKAVPRKLWINGKSWINGHPIDIRREIML